MSLFHVIISNILELYRKAEKVEKNLREPKKALGTYFASKSSILSLLQYMDKVTKL
jgi:hypothetical protein